MKKAYHRFMFTTSLLFGSLSFRFGGIMLSVAIKHQAKMDVPIPEFQPRDPGYLYPADMDGEFDWDAPPKPPFFKVTPRSNNVTWLDAMPEQCPLCGKAETCEECRA